MQNPPFKGFISASFLFGTALGLFAVQQKRIKHRRSPAHIVFHKICCGK